ncbi:immunity protein Imm33 domain-containing protein [Myroides sp. LJL116]
MNWKDFEKKQKEICAKYGANWVSTSESSIMGLADDLSLTPIYGIRNFKKGNTNGWFIWSGEYSYADDFYKPVCAGHLLDKNTTIINYLGLPEGWGFIIDSNGYEDVWFDSNYLK